MFTRCVCIAPSEKVGRWMCLCITDLAAGEYVRGGGSQWEVKLSEQQQDSQPEVSRVTCQAKEITACHSTHQPGPALVTGAAKQSTQSQGSDAMT